VVADPNFCDQRAMRFNVHNSLGKPHAIAPASSSFWSFSRCFAVSLRGVPASLGTNAVSPCSSSPGASDGRLPGRLELAGDLAYPFPCLESFTARRRASPGSRRIRWSHAP